MLVTFLRYSVLLDSGSLICVDFMSLFVIHV